jgi:hypothetical protein
MLCNNYLHENLFDRNIYCIKFKLHVATYRVIYSNKKLHSVNNLRKKLLQNMFRNFLFNPL